tara:strand:- start:292 stop:606 length:315 start_codon:yes stop_codon:yes gene_type:complete
VLEAKESAVRARVVSVPANASAAVASSTTPLSIVVLAVQLVKFPDVGVPRAGVTKVGLVSKTRLPVPVSSEIAASKFAEVGVAKKVATFVPNPLTPVDTGNPVA